MSERLYPEKNKADMLNVLRFIAFMMIFLLHAKAFIPVNWNENCSGAWLLYTPAWAGTWIFFMLSGYGVGAGFYSGKYECSINGVAKFYIKRITSIVPIYWFWVVTVAIFVKPEILMPSLEHFGYLVKLLLFCYQEEFFSAEFGLGWYMTTLLRLYLAAPFGYLLLRRLVKTKKQIYCALFMIISVGFVARCLMGYHIAVTGNGSWSPNIYKPFYFNFDIFFSGMLLNQLKEYKSNIAYVHKKVGRGLSMAALLLLILINSRIYYDYAYGISDYLNIYCYVFPSVYIAAVAFFIYYFEIYRDFIQTKLEIGQLRKNFLRLFDYFNKIQFPIYLFHSSVLLCLAGAYNETSYMKLCRMFLVPLNKTNFAIGCLYTFSALLLSIGWSLIVYNINVLKGVGRIRTNLQKIDYSAVYRKGIQILQQMFPV